MENNPETIDEETEVIVTHSKRSKTKELIACIFWSIIGIGFIVIGAILVDESILLRIVAILAGSLLFLIFLESYISKLTNKIIINQEEIKFRRLFKWEKLSWDNVKSIEVEKRSTAFKRNENNQKLIILKLIADEENCILFPLHRFDREEADKILDLIKLYYRKHCGSELEENIVPNE